MTTYCFRNNILVAKHRPSEADAAEIAIRAGRAYRRGAHLIWRVPGEVAAHKS